MNAIHALLHEESGLNKFTTKVEDVVSLFKGNLILKNSKIESFKDQKYILIGGAPGVGKTFLMKRISMG